MRGCRFRALTRWGWEWFCREGGNWGCRALPGYLGQGSVVARLGLGCWVGDGAKVQHPRVRLIQISWVPSRERVR